MPGTLHIITGASGTGIASSLDHFALERGAVHIKLEDFLVQAATPYVRELVDPSLGPNTSATIIDTFRLPEAVLRELWPSALEAAFNGGPGIDAPTVRSELQSRSVFFSFHACWYHLESSAFVTGVDTECFQRLLLEYEMKPKLVVTLIDDVYDCLVRLRRQGQIFAPTTRERDHPVASLAWLLLKILSWREFEVRFSQQIARAIEAKHFLFPVKHPARTFEKLLDYPGQRCVYLSHPISVPRRAGLSSDSEDGSQLVQYIEATANVLRNDDEYVLFEPTAIDELRFAGTSAEPGTMTARWHLTGQSNVPPMKLIWDGLESQEERAQAEQPFLRLVHTDSVAGEPLHDTDASGALRVLQDEIRKQINWRDRQLVEQCDTSVNIRPFANPEGRVSGGVAEELKLHAALMAYEAGDRSQGDTPARRSRSIIYHPPEDERRRQCGSIIAVCDSRAKLDELKNWTDEARTGLLSALQSEQLSEWLTEPDGAGDRIERLFRGLPVPAKPAFEVSAREGPMQESQRLSALPQLRRSVGDQICQALRGLVAVNPDFDSAILRDGEKTLLITEQIVEGAQLGHRLAAELR